MSLKRIAVFGGTGNLGPDIVGALEQAKFDVTVLSRSAEHPAHLPRGVTIKQVKDFTSVSELTEVLQGQDAVVAVPGPVGIPLQHHVIDAAVAAGVKYFLPSEFGSRTDNAHARKLPVFAGKLKVQDQLEKLAQEGKISYVFVNTGAFFDWGLDMGFLITDVLGQKPISLYNGGDVEFSTSTLADIGKAVVGILQKPEQFRNRFVTVNSAVVTQNQLIAAAKKVVPDAPFNTTPVDTEVVLQKSLETIKSGQGDIHGAMLGGLMSAIFNPSYGGKFPQEDSHTLGLGIDQAGVEAVVAKSIQKKQQAK
ncbi:hypothetical protein ANO11243_001940 [Dothideomycetidae sp. 11243]|nr:hypothetical protein ANO11243_001940 [fungal sp. No.11243]